MSCDRSMSCRDAFKTAKTVVVKVGTSVVSRPDGSLAIGRIASVVEQIAALHQMGKRVVLVASGAIGVGATRLSEQATLARSVRSHLHGVRIEETSARARAAAGQGGLMGLYDTLFSHYSVACGQLLVTESDFACGSRKERFCKSLCWLLDAGGVPLINENDVVARPVRTASRCWLNHRTSLPMVQGRFRDGAERSRVELHVPNSACLPLRGRRSCASSSLTTIRSPCSSP